MFSTKDLYMKACMQSSKLHAMTDEEKKCLQAHLRKMYLEIETVCDRHHLRMCTGYGTVLGAMRHHGFIPWDDDMDILMPREDYDKLIANYADELPNNYKIFAPNSKQKAIYRFAKVVDTNTRLVSPGAEQDEAHGVFIDIFPLEFAPKNKFILKWRNAYTRFLLLLSSCAVQYKQNSMFYKELMCSTPSGKRTYLIRKFIGLLSSFRSVTAWYNRVDNYCKYSHDTGMVNVPSDGGLVKSLVPHTMESYFPARKVKFDDIEVYVPNDAIAYLENNYGNWKKIPPLDQRWQHFVEEFRLN